MGGPGQALANREVHQALTTIVATHSMHAECSFLIVMAEYRNNGMGLLCPLGVSVWAGTELTT